MPPESTRTFVMGFDLGKDGSDQSALTIGYRDGDTVHVCALVEGEDAVKLYAALTQPPAAEGKLK